MVLVGGECNFLLFVNIFFLFLWNHSDLISGNKMRKCKSTMFSSTEVLVVLVGLLALFYSPKLCNGVVAAEKLVCSSSLSYTLVQYLGDLEFAWQIHCVCVQCKGNKQAIEVSLISEQADSCDIFFHLFVVVGSLFCCFCFQE